MAHLTSQEALQLAADFALKAERMRADDAPDFQSKAELYETASRVAFLKARVLADERRSSSSSWHKSSAPDVRLGLNQPQ